MCWVSVAARKTDQNLAVPAAAARVLLSNVQQGQGSAQTACVTSAPVQLGQLQTEDWKGQRLLLTQLDREIPTAGACKRWGSRGTSLSLSLYAVSGWSFRVTSLLRGQCRLWRCVPLEGGQRETVPPLETQPQTPYNGTPPSPRQPTEAHPLPGKGRLFFLQLLMETQEVSRGTRTTDKMVVAIWENRHPPPWAVCH